MTDQRAAPERCTCDAFNEAVNDELIYLDPASEDESARWLFDSRDDTGDTRINFCPFCGMAAPTTSRLW